MLTSEKNINNYVIIVTESNNGDRMLIQNNVRLRETDFKNENELQTFIENNIETIFNLQLVKSQFVIETFRFDTLAYDEETNAFVILEYKNTKNNSFVDQGMSYSSALRRRKEKAILECLKTSWDKVNGHKMDYFLFSLSFIGWALLCIFIIPIIFVVPYIVCANTMYINELLKEDTK